MSVTWQCASIRPGMTVAPPSLTTSAPGAAARTAPAGPMSAIRPSRISMPSPGPASAAIVTKTASSTTRSMAAPPGLRVQPRGPEDRSAAGHRPDAEYRGAEELVHHVGHALQPGHVDLAERVGIERHDRGLHLGQAERGRQRLHGLLHGRTARVRDPLPLLERGAELRERLRMQRGPLPGDGAALNRERLGRALV